MASQAERIILKFDGPDAVGKALGIPRTTVLAWLSSGTIPAKYHLQILEAAREQDVDLTPFDFVADLAEAFYGRAFTERAADSQPSPSA